MVMFQYGLLYSRISSKSIQVYDESSIIFSITSNKEHNIKIYIRIILKQMLSKLLVKIVHVCLKYH